MCRKMAELMQDIYDVEVVTTKAVDYVTWNNEYEHEKEIINGVTVRRFPVERPRIPDQFNIINGKFLNGHLKKSEEYLWLEEQGPYVPELIQYIHEHSEDYAVYVFFTYLYYPTVKGVREVKEKAIVVPCTHDEPFLKMKMFRSVFLEPRAFLFNTDEERILVRKKYNNYYIPYVCGGAGVDVPPNVSGNAFKKKFHLNRYIIYVGRMDEGKNCQELFEYFQKYKKTHPSDLKLVLLGKASMSIPEQRDIISLGYVSDTDKFNGIAGAEFLTLPSRYESLSLVVLEAFALGKPVLVNGVCAVLKAHCEKSRAGFWYKGYSEFEKKTSELLNSDTLKAELGKNGKKYIDENYQWETIKRKFSDLIEYVSENQE